MIGERRELLLLLSIHEQNVNLSQRLEKMMTDAATATADLNAGITAIKTAVSDAAGAIKDLAAKLAGASSVNPGDVETAALSLKQIAAGLEAVVAAANEPVTEPAPPIVEPQPEPAPVVSPAPDGDFVEGVGLVETPAPAPVVTEPQP